MLGFVFAAACLLGIFVLVRRGRRWHGPGRRRVRHGLYRMFDELDTTPGQEKVIRAAVDDLKDAARGAGSEVFEARKELAALLREAQVDEARMEGVFARLDGTVATVRTAAREALSKVHGALDERQRERLARRLERGWVSRVFMGPERSHARC